VACPSLDIPVQRGFGDVEGFTNLGHGVTRVVIECLRHGYLVLGCQCFWSAAFFPLALAAVSPAWVRSRIISRSNSASAPKKDMKNELSSGCGGVDILGDAFEANLPLIKRGNGCNQMLEGVA
jgi:hypothetical protein